MARERMGLGGRWMQLGGATALVGFVLAGPPGCSSDVEPSDGTGMGGAGVIVQPGQSCSGNITLMCICEGNGLQGATSCVDGQFSECACDPSVCQNDEQCSDGVFCNGVEICAPQSDEADDFGCVESAPPECDDDDDCTIDSCDDAANRCLFVPQDRDRDGHGDAACGGDDCDDEDVNRFPGNYEVCDEEGVDEDCDPNTFGEKDEDGDGATDEACCNGDNCGRDCDDTSNRIHPSQLEICDSIDNDCDGDVDEEVNEVPWYLDVDGDGFGTTDEENIPLSCFPLPGRSLLFTDCDDSDPSRHPGQLEICDLKDNDCDETADEGPLCGVPDGYPFVDENGDVITGGGDGDGDAGMGGGGPTCTEPQTYYQDVDGDGWGDVAGQSTETCTPPPGFVTLVGDCNDNDGTIFPGARELCDLKDNDCNGVSDENSVGLTATEIIGPTSGLGQNQGAIAKTSTGFLGIYQQGNSSDIYTETFAPDGTPQGGPTLALDPTTLGVGAGQGVEGLATGDTTVLAMVRTSGNHIAGVLFDHAGNAIKEIPLGDGHIGGATWTGSDYFITYTTDLVYTARVDEAGFVSGGTTIVGAPADASISERVAANGTHIAVTWNQGNDNQGRVFTNAGAVVGTANVFTGASGSHKPKAIAGTDNGFWLAYGGGFTTTLAFVGNDAVEGVNITSLPDLSGTPVVVGTKLGDEGVCAVVLCVQPQDVAVRLSPRLGEGEIEETVRRESAPMDVFLLKALRKALLF